MVAERSGSWRKRDGREDRREREREEGKEVFGQIETFTLLDSREKERQREREREREIVL